MTAVIFAGPSIHGLNIASRPDLDFRPPAKQGDVFRATQSNPKAIGLIDGYFDGVPSVWHKEILWALAQGIPVYGSASMGALRAAELDAFGMIGVGRIYHWYRDGVLEDDDEVALIHGPRDTGFVPLSEPMVNVRATCEAGVDAGGLDQQTADVIVASAKSLHYRNRTWEDVIAAARAQRSAAASLDTFVSWLAAGFVDQKRLDAEALIAAVSTFIENPVKFTPPHFRFEWTDLWDRVVHEWTVSEPPANDPESVSQSVVLDELRLDPDRYAEIRSQALLRAVLLREADRRDIAADRAQKLRQLVRMRERLGLMRKADLDAWAKRNALSADELETLIGEVARIEAVSRLPPGSIDRHILAVLQLCGTYAEAAERARAKRGVLEKSGVLVDGRLTDTLSPPMLLGWFFGKRRRQAIPEDLDTFIGQIGLSSRQAFYRLLTAEYLYSQGESDGGGVKQAAMRRP